MESFVTGQVVFSKAGRDKLNFFVVVTVEGEYLYLSDGAIRKLSSPKKKKQKHVRPVNFIDYELKKKLESNTALDADVRKTVQPFNSRTKA
ncbi:MAG: KOW domain-containing RNA-binding protein [Clostridiales bacterium]|jgi:ribosomal protein L14E/L6E/L27E|nr:KOW domain-containing RNA-binding protein [Clostridiales bacterium]